MIEVADTTVETDRSVKVPLYARAGIAEAWLVDLTESRVEVYRQPTPQGYQEVSCLEYGERLHVTAFPDLTLQVGDMFGPI